MSKNKGSVLVVDDKGIVAKDIAKKVKNLGYTVPATAANSKDAVEKAGKHKPDIILMDIKLKSKKDGIETADEIFRKYKIPVIYLTAYSDEDTLERAKNTNPYGYIIKPFEEKELEVNLELAFHRLEIERALEEKEEQYKILVENSVEVIWTMDLEGNFTYMSPSVEILRGYTVEEAMSLTLEETMTPESFAVSMTELQNYLSKPVDELPYSYTIELEQYRKDGTTVWTLVTIKAIFDDDGEVIELQGGTLDITERKQMDIIREVTYNIANVATHNISLEDLYLFIHTEISTILKANNFYISLFDPENEMLSFPYYVDEHKPDGYGPPIPIRKQGKGLTEYTLKKGKGLLLLDTTIEKLSKKGDIDIIGPVPKNWLGVPLKVDGRNIGVIVLQDYKDSSAYTKKDQRLLEFISGQVAIAIERNRVDKVLAESEEKYRTIMNHLNDAFYAHDFKGKIIDVNPNSCKMLGYKKEELVGQHLSIFTSEEETLLIKKRVKKLIKEKKLVFEGEHITKKGVTIPVSISASTISAEGAGLIHSFVRDISELKNVENALRTSEEKYSALVEHSRDIIIIVQEGKITYVNKAAKHMTGEELDKIIGKDFISWVAPEFREKIIQMYTDRMSGKDVPNIYEVKIRKKDGSYFPVEINASMITYQGKPADLAIVRDISERKKAELAMRASEERYRNIVELSPDGIMTISKTGKVLGVNKSFCELTGFDEENFVGKSIAKIPTRPKGSFGDAIKTITKALSGADLKTIDFKWTHKNGEARDGEAKLKKIGKGEAGYLQAVVRDVTDEKKAEIALRASEEKYRTLFEHSPESIILVDLEGKILECNNVTTKLTGYSKKELIGNSYVDLGLIHKDDVEKYATLFLNALKSGEISIFEARMKHKDGHDYWIEGYPSFLYANGEVSAIQVISRDITERKSTEKEMRRRFLKYALDEGNIYIVKERRHIRSADAFNELMQIGYPGLIISRKPLKHFKDRIDQEYAHLWISEREGEHNITPKKDDIINMIDSISRGQVVFLDGINYLISKIGFKSCQSLIQTLSEIAHLKDHIIIIQIDPLSLTPYQLSQFESEAQEIEPQMSEGKLPEKLIDVLKFVNDSNNEGAKPSYSDIGTELELSKPTIRGRVRKLESMGYLNEMTKGRSKYLEITEKGKTYMAFK